MRRESELAEFGEDFVGVKQGTGLDVGFPLGQQRVELAWREGPEGFLSLKGCQSGEDGLLGGGVTAAFHARFQRLLGVGAKGDCHSSPAGG